MYAPCKIKLWKMLRMTKYRENLSKYFTVLLFVVHITARLKTNTNLHVI